MRRPLRGNLFERYARMPLCSGGICHRYEGQGGKCCPLRLVWFVDFLTEINAGDFGGFDQTLRIERGGLHPSHLF